MGYPARNGVPQLDVYLLTPVSAVQKHSVKLWTDSKIFLKIMTGFRFQNPYYFWLLIIFIFFSSYFTVPFMETFLCFKLEDFFIPWYFCILPFLQPQSFGIILPFLLSRSFRLSFYHSHYTSFSAFCHCTSFRFGQHPSVSSNFSLPNHYFLLFIISSWVLSSASSIFLFLFFLFLFINSFISYSSQFMNFWSVGTKFLILYSYSLISHSIAFSPFHQLLFSDHIHFFLLFFFFFTNLPLFHYLHFQWFFFILFSSSILFKPLFLQAFIFLIFPI